MSPKNENKKSIVRNDYYEAMTARNIGLVTPEEQGKIRKSRIAICGLGGLGGPVAEMLARSGVEDFVLLDNGKFEISNLNRQIFCFEETIGQYKTDATEYYLKKINPAIRTKKYLEVTAKNVEEMLADVDAVVLGIDSISAVLLLSREARKKNIPLIEGWAVPVANVRVFTNETMSLEEVYNLKLQDLDIENMTKAEEYHHTFEMIRDLMNIEGSNVYSNPERLERYETKMQTTTLAPLVWMTCSMMTIETLKIILHWNQSLALAPEIVVYDPLYHKKRAYINHSKNIETLASE